MASTQLTIIDPQEFEYSYGHLKVRFERYHKGWVTWASAPNPVNGRVYRVTHGGNDASFDRFSEHEIRWFCWEGINKAKGEIWVNRHLLESTE